MGMSNSKSADGLPRERPMTERIEAEERPGRRKRKRTVSTEREEIEKLLSTPKKKKLKTTSQYIFENLFKNGRDSDITITALGNQWKLHKLYLCQSAYFSSMFSGRWVDASKDTVDLVIDDPNITIKSLHITLGSFYRDEVTIEPCDVVSVLATASLFQLEGLINQCIVIMEETINSETVVKYHESSIMYGCTSLTKSCIKWLLVNLLSLMPDNPARLREIPPCLMSQLISSPHLFVMQTEFSVYVLLRLWVYLNLHPNCNQEPRESVNHSQKFFRSLSLTEDGKTNYFLNSERAEPFLSVFRNMRIVHMINHHLDLQILTSDRLIPDTWLSSAYHNRWMSLLQVDSGVDKGPVDLTEEVFDREAYRCGRILQQDGHHMWRWTGFNCGLDLIVTYEDHKLSLKRGSLQLDHEALLSNQRFRHVAYRVAVVSLNEQKQRIYEESSGVKQVTLALNQSVEILSLDPVQTVFPLSLSFNFCLSSPPSVES